MNGRLIVIEGTDCSGKETQSRLLVEALKKEGKKAVHLSFPMYDTPTGKIVGGCYLGREENGPGYFTEGATNVDPKVACLYYAADRKYNIGLIQDYLNQGYDTVVDRYTSSNMAHQGSKLDKEEDRFQVYQWIDRLEYWLLELPKPDLTIFLHVPFQNSIELRKSRHSIDEHERDDEHLKRAEKTYIELSGLYHWDTVQCVKDGMLKSIDQIHQDVLDIVTSKKKPR